jgi:hypothetical protein
MPDSVRMPAPSVFPRYRAWVEWIKDFGHVGWGKASVVYPLRIHTYPSVAHYELQDNMEQPARWRAQSGRLAAKTSLSGCSA